MSTDPSSAPNLAPDGRPPPAGGQRPRHISEFAGIFLPIGQMLQIERVIELTHERIVCEADLPRNWVFEVHFPGDPIFPGSLMVEAAGQAIAIWAWENGMRGDPRLVRVGAEFRSPVRPEDGTLTYSATVRRRQSLCVGRVEVIAGNRQVAVIEESLLVSPHPLGDRNNK